MQRLEACVDKGKRSKNMSFLRIFEQKSLILRLAKNQKNVDISMYSRILRV